VGSIRGFNGFLHALSTYTQCVVVGVDYPLAPDQARFPEIPEDCYRATVWASEQVNYKHVCVRVLIA